MTQQSTEANSIVGGEVMDVVGIMACALSLVRGLDTIVFLFLMWIAQNVPEIDQK